MVKKTPVKKASRRALLSAVGAVAGGVALAGGAPAIHAGRYRLFAGAFANTSKTYSRRTIDLVAENTVIDMLGVLAVSEQAELGWLADPDSYPATNLADLKASGINVFHQAVGYGGPNARDIVLRYFGGWNGFIANYDQDLMRIDSVADLDRVKASGKVGILLGLQNSDHFQTVDDVDLFFGLGQRVSQLTYNSQNLLGAGSTERGADGGLTDFGAAVIARMNAVGMAVDLSHCGDVTTLEGIEASTRPPLITHSNCRALAPGHPRCKPDDVIRALGRAGGVMGITAIRNFVRNAEPTTIEDVVDHYDHAARLIGIENLGIGTDADLYGYDALPEDEYRRLKAYYKGAYAFREKIDIEGMDHPRKIFDLTEAFVRRGYTDSQISGILGGNFRRVLAQIWPARA